MSVTPLFTFEVSTYSSDEEPMFELRMRHRGRIVWSEKTAVDFGAQNTDDPYEPSSPLTCEDLTWALGRAGWQTLGDWDYDASDPGYLTANIRPTPYATPHVTLSPSALAMLT